MDLYAITVAFRTALSSSSALDITRLGKPAPGIAGLVLGAAPPSRARLTGHARPVPATPSFDDHCQP